jgi:RHS repeat-associated protein
MGNISLALSLRRDAYTYDKVGNRQDMTVTDSGGTKIHVYTYDDSGNMTADGTYTYDYDPENRLIRVHQSGSWSPPSLGQALDSGLTFTTGGADEWTTTYAESKQGWYAARSGYLDGEQESWLQTQVEGSGTVTFWWKVSSEEGSDYLEFWLDGVRQSGSISGSVDWEQKSFTVGTGTHTFKWRYSKSGSGYAGDDCGYVDWVQWSGSCPPAPEPDPAAWTTLLYRAACPERSERDAAGRRVEKLYNYATITKYVYDGDHCIAGYDGSGNLRRKYIYGPSVDEPISMIEAAGSYAGTYYYHFDALGSVVGLTNASGTTVEVYEYDVYGRVGATDASHPNRILFTGREYDKETGLYYYRARYYNPQIGRFLQTDPIGYGDGMNWYRYCGNSPINGTDPLGQEFWEYWRTKAWQNKDRVATGELDTRTYFTQDWTTQTCAIWSTANLYVARDMQNNLAKRTNYSASAGPGFIMDTFEKWLGNTGNYPADKDFENYVWNGRVGKYVPVLKDNWPDWKWGTTGLPDLSYVHAFVKSDMAYDFHVASRNDKGVFSETLQSMTDRIKKGPVILALSTKTGNRSYDLSSCSDYHVVVVRYQAGAQSKIGDRLVSTPYEIIDPITGPLYFGANEFLQILDELAANQMVVPQ